MKEVARQIVIFERDNKGYTIYLGIQGYQTTINCLLFIEKLPLGWCREADLDLMIEMFKCCNHNIEIKEENRSGS